MESKAGSTGQQGMQGQELGKQPHLGRFPATALQPPAVARNRPSATTCNRLHSTSMQTTWLGSSTSAARSPLTHDAAQATHACRFAPSHT